MDENNDMGSVRQSLDIIIATLIHGLKTDGLHHKQYDLETVLRLLAGDEWVDNAYRDDPWEKGSPS